ncbi:hypothetical protein ACF09K_31285 [Streptomyces sp. NPDC014882]|uniref:hypothetical protein n=1 Tax=Streptomyces sp. NPDC014882 TaxID=3364927 RepID=UPI0036F7D1BD
MANTGVHPGAAGLVSGLVDSTRHAGGSVGLAVLVSVAAATPGTGPAGAGDSGGYDAALPVAVATATVGALVAVLIVPRRETPPTT